MIQRAVDALRARLTLVVGRDNDNGANARIPKLKLFKPELKRISMPVLKIHERGTANAAIDGVIAMVVSKMTGANMRVTFVTTTLLLISSENSNRSIPASVT
jgi:hypothetical protein